MSGPSPPTGMTSAIEPWSPIKISDIDFPEYSQENGMVVWGGEGINLWRASDGYAASVDPSWDAHEMEAGTLSDGWFTWWGAPKGDWEMYWPEDMFGIPVSEISLP